MNEIYEEMESIRSDFCLTVKAFCELIRINLYTYYSYKNARNPSGSLKVLLDLINDDPEGIMKRLRKRIRKSNK